MKTKDILFKTLLKAERMHNWGKMLWLSYCRVWIRGCPECGAIEIWRGNDTVYYGPTPEMPTVKTLIVFHHNNEFTRDNKTAYRFLQEVLRELKEYG